MIFLQYGRYRVKNREGPHRIQKVRDAAAEDHEKISKVSKTKRYREVPEGPLGIKGVPT